jgi:hypothetical protein
MICVSLLEQSLLMQEVCFKAKKSMLQQVNCIRFSPQAITSTLIPESLLPQTRDLWLGESSPSGSRGVPGGRIKGVEGERSRKRENQRDSLRLLSTDCS